MSAPDAGQVPDPDDAEGRGGPRGGGRPDQQPLPGAGVALGVVAGVGLQLALGFILTVALMGTGREDLAIWAIFVVAAVALVVMLVPRWRRAGAGMVLGLAVGSIVFAGICGAYLANPPSPGQEPGERPVPVPTQGQGQGHGAGLG